MSLYPAYKPPPANPGVTEFEILKEHHKFLREDIHPEGGASHSKSWGDRLASKYESGLFREFALCDLKHYKSGNFSLRWRTEDEVLSSAGESSCSNTRCEFHAPREDEQPTTPSLSTLELPFAYVEHGEQKSALVKVVLCKRCVKRLMWKRNKDKEASVPASTAVSTSHEAPTASEPPLSTGKTRPAERSHDGPTRHPMVKSKRHHPYKRPTTS